MFRAALASKPALLMIYQADLVDSCSLATLLQIADEVGSEGLPERQNGNGQYACGGIILATCQALPSSDPGMEVSGPWALHGDISHILLQPLQRAEVEQLARQALGCSAVRDNLLDVLIGERPPPPPPPSRRHARATITYTHTSGRSIRDKALILKYHVCTVNDPYLFTQSNLKACLHTWWNCVNGCKTVPCWTQTETAQQEYAEELLPLRSRCRLSRTSSDTRSISFHGSKECCFGLRVYLA